MDKLIKKRIIISTYIITSNCHTSLSCLFNASRFYKILSLNLNTSTSDIPPLETENPYLNGLRVESLCIVKSIIFMVGFLFSPIFFPCLHSYSLIIHVHILVIILVVRWLCHAASCKISAQRSRGGS